MMRRLVVRRGQCRPGHAGLGQGQQDRRRGPATACSGLSRTRPRWNPVTRTVPGPTSTPWCTTAAD